MAAATRDNAAHLMDLLATLVNKELKVRYRGTVLGVLWSLANPIAFAAVLYVAFRKVFQLDIENYPFFILAALFPWQWVQTSLNNSSLLFFANASMIKKHPFPRVALCLAVAVGDMIHFLATLPVLAMLHWISLGRLPDPIWLIGIPLLVAIQLIMLTASVVLIATANAFFRDLEQLVRVALLLLFYSTPILFDFRMVPESLHVMLWANPLSPLIVAWRTLLLEGSLSWFAAAAAGYAALAVVAALYVYRRLGWQVPEVV